MKALLIHHRGAGTGTATRKSLTEALERRDWKVRYLPRGKADAKAIRSADPDLVVIAGGDGTVAAMLSMLPDREVPAAILPTGTANNIARSLGMIGDAATLVAGWDMARRRRFDIGNALGPWGCRTFAEGVGFGAFADSLARAPDVDGPEKLSAGRRALAEALRDAEPLKLEIELDGRRISGNLLIAEVMNVPLTGPRLPIAPDADAGDGKLHLACLRNGDRAAMIEWLRSDRDGDPPVEQTSGAEAVVRGGDAPMRIDDQACRLEAGSEVVVRLEGMPVQLLAPPEAPALAG